LSPFLKSPFRILEVVDSFENTLKQLIFRFTKFTAPSVQQSEFNVDSTPLVHVQAFQLLNFSTSQLPSHQPALT